MLDQLHFHCYCLFVTDLEAKIAETEDHSKQSYIITVATLHDVLMSFR